MNGVKVSGQVIWKLIKLLKLLNALLDYARDVTQCRRQALLKLLNYDARGESPENLCCDVCEKEAAVSFREEAALLNFFHKNKRCYTLNQAASVLTKAKGFLWSDEEAKQAINHLIDIGKLSISKNIFWKGTITG